MIKKIAAVFVAVALAGLLSQSAQACGGTTGGKGVPDSGATVGLVVMAIAGLAAAKTFLRK
jgi:hypothetical protein